MASSLLLHGMLLHLMNILQYVAQSNDLGEITSQSSGPQPVARKEPSMTKYPEAFPSSTSGIVFDTPQVTPEGHPCSFCGIRSVAVRGRFSLTVLAVFLPLGYMESIRYSVPRPLGALGIRGDISVSVMPQSTQTGCKL